MRRKLVILVGVLGGLFFLLLVGAYLASGSLIRTGVESGAGAALGTKTTLEGASLSLFSGTLTLTSLSIGNPDGFSTPRAFHADEIEVTANVASFLSDVIQIRSVIIDAPEIALEVSLGGSNLGRLIRNVDQSDTTEGTSGTTETGASPASHGPPVQIDRVELRNAKVIVAQSAVGRDDDEVVLEKIELTNLGQGEPTTVPRVIQEVLRAVLTKVAAQNDLPPEVVELLDEKIPGVGGVQEGLQKLEGIFKGKKRD